MLQGRQREPSLKNVHILGNCGSSGGTQRCASFFLNRVKKMKITHSADLRIELKTEALKVTLAIYYISLDF